MHRQFLRFTVAGVIGFLVDTGILYIGLAMGLGYYIGRAISFLSAAFTTWQINRRHTFMVQHGQRLSTEWFRYLLAMSGGGAINYACYGVIVHVMTKTVLLPAFAVAMGSLAGLTVNFLTAKFWVFKENARDVDD